MAYRRLYITGLKVIPVGGGGLIAGIAVAIKTMKPNCLVIGVETERSPGFSHAMSEGRPEFTPTESSLADGLAVPLVGFNSFATAAPLIDKVRIRTQLERTAKIIGSNYCYR